MTSLRSRSLRVFTTAGVAATALVVPFLGTGTAQAVGVTTTPASQVGIYGSSDPTYDGVYRQSLAILGQRAANETPDAGAVQWLKDQQCDNGGFSSFNPDISTDCPPLTLVPSPWGDYYVGGYDTNATALAALALKSVDWNSDEADAAYDYLKSVQETDGGWEFTVDSNYGSDPNSTGLALLALSAIDQDPTYNARGFIDSHQVGRELPQTSDVEDRGGIDSTFTPGVPNVSATVQAIAGSTGIDLTDVWTPTLTEWSRSAATVEAPDTDTDSDTWGARWIADQATAGNITGANSAWAILALAGNQTGRAAAEKLYDSYVDELDPSDPGQLGLAALAATSMRETTDAQTFATLIAATQTGSSEETGRPDDFSVSSSAVWLTQSVTVKNPFGGVTPVTTSVDINWGDASTSTGVVTTTKAHTYAAAGTFAIMATLKAPGFARGVTFPVGTVKVSKDTFKPTVAVTKPARADYRAYWKYAAGTAKDTGLGVSKVTVRATQKRGTAWYAFTGAAWVKTASESAAVTKAKAFAIVPKSTGTWSVSLPGVSTGYLRLRSVATDKAGNNSLGNVFTQLITK